MDSNKRSLISSILLLIAIILFCKNDNVAMADTQNIYLDSNYNINGDGSISSPYNTLSSLNWATISTWVSNGDSVFINLKCNSEFRELLTIGASGTSNNSIVFRSYSVGNLPIINGSIKYSGDSGYEWINKGSNVYFLQSNYDLLVRPGGLWINGNYSFESEWPLNNNNRWYWGNEDNLSNDTIYIYSTENPRNLIIEGSQYPGCVYGSRKNYITFENIEFKQSGGYSSGYSYHALMYIYESDYWTVSNCILHDSSSLLGVIQLMRSSYFTIDESHVYNSYDPDHNGYGTLIGSSSQQSKQSVNNTIKNCIIHDNYASKSDLIGNTGTWNEGIAYGPSNWNIFNNIIYGHAQNAIYFRSGASNNYIHHNYIYNIQGYQTTGGIGIQLRDRANNNWVYNNVLINVYGPTMQSDGKNGGPNSTDPTCFGNKFYYNTIINGNMPNANGFHFFGTNYELEVKNNIVVSNTGDMILIGANTSDLTHNGITLSNNRYFKTTTIGQEFVYRGTNYLTLSEMQDAMLQDGFPNEENSSYGDPGFIVDLPTSISECMPSINSPCIDNATPINNIEDDYFGTIRPFGFSPDIGACEYILSGPKNLRIVTSP